MAKIPTNRVKRTVANLKIGEEGYVSTGALIVTEDRECYLKTDAQLLVEPSEFGTLLVRRVTGPSGQGWDVTLVYGRHYRGTTVWEAHSGALSLEWMPVTSYAEQELAS